MNYYDSKQCPVLTLDGFGGGMMSFDAGGMAFLVGELEKRDARLREPLASVDWPRDIPVESGGGRKFFVRQPGF